MFNQPKKIKWNEAGLMLLVSLLFLSVYFFCMVFHYSLLIPLILIFIGIHLSFIKKATFKMLAQLGLLMAIIIVACHFANQYPDFSHYLLPVSAIAMLTVLLFNDLHLAVLVAFSGSLIASMMLGDNYEMMVIFFLGGLTGAYVVKDTRTRGRLLYAGFLVSAVNVLCLFLFTPDWHIVLKSGYLKEQLYPLIANGILASLFIAATLKVFESLFRVLTNFSLLELADFNQPLLKKLIIEAPGTYHHSMVVSNLAEAAADAIGANGLLARVGAYYHDIGKMTHPEYFTENQLMGGSNKHDELEPNVSRLVILNHVKEGMELAKKYKLNQAIIDFIPQHHGTGLIYYFYQKTIEQSQEGEEVLESNFRYPGPKPQTKETAITMLADSSEGSTRALDEQTPQSIEETVRKVINNKFIDGQLDECNLTLKEIEKISSTFTRILTSMYHGRIKYPEKKNGHHNRKSADKNSAQHSPSQEDHPKDH